MEIIHEAQRYFKSVGIPQWQNGYPNEEQIQKDIEASGSYVLVEDSQIVGTFFITFDGESSYDKIYDGKWINEEQYATIHRIAITSSLKGKGLSSKLFDYATVLTKEKGLENIKADTHALNTSMQRALSKNGFIPCGNIFLSDGSPRIGFQKIIQH